VLGIVAFWWLGDVGVGRDCDDDATGREDDVMLVEGGGEYGRRNARRRMKLGVLFLGAATRLLLGALGTTAMVRVVGDRSVLKRGSFIAVEVLGWLLV
jgi:hypothetical protein